MAWPVDLIATVGHWEAVRAARAAKGKRQRPGGEEEERGRLPPPKRSIMDLLLQQRSNNPQQIQQLAAHPKLGEVMGEAGKALGVDGDVITYIIKTAAPLGADLLAHYKPVQPQQKKGDAGRKKDGVDGRAFTVLGEPKNAAKVLNGEDRLARPLEVEQEQRAQADAGARRDAILASVNTTLLRCQVIDQLPARGKKPTVAQMRAFISKYPGIIAWWRVYLQKHGVGGGDTIAWKYYFDFIHGGCHNHATVKDGQPALPLVLDEQKGGADAPSSASDSAMVEGNNPPAQGTTD